MTIKEKKDFRFTRSDRREDDFYVLPFIGFAFLIYIHEHRRHGPYLYDEFDGSAK
jgi:hypothetical protein